MCFNYGYDLDEYKLKRLSGPRLKHYLDNIDGKLSKRVFQASGFAHPYMPIITADKPEVIQALKWGYIPKYDDGKDAVKTIKRWNSTLNCRSETMFEKISFKNECGKGQRCLIITDGVYEYHTQGKKKFPFYIRRKDGQAFFVAGIYCPDSINKITGEIFAGFSMLTCSANALLNKIHNELSEEGDTRMVVIIPDEFIYDWLNPSLTMEDVKAFCQPFDDSQLEAHSVSKLITSRKENSNVAEVQQPFIYPDLELMLS